MNIVIYDEITKEIYAIIPNELYCSNDDVILKSNLEIATEYEEDFIIDIDGKIYYRDYLRGD